LHHFDHSVTNRPGADSVLLLLSLVSRTLCRPNEKVNVGHKLRPLSACPGALLSRIDFKWNRIRLIPCSRPKPFTAAESVPINITKDGEQSRGSASSGRSLAHSARFDSRPQVETSPTPVRPSGFFRVATRSAVECLQDPTTSTLSLAAWYVWNIGFHLLPRAIQGFFGHQRSL
jgi:hypothetical protein